jgi:ubiquinone/menaquinone biosynthesis C-methylase UbiE
MKRRARSAPKAKTTYIHGYDAVEQRRLLAQAKYLEKAVYTGIDFDRTQHVLEIGCGVGAQTKILLKRFPKLSIDGVDLSENQLERASRYLSREIADGRVRLFRANATDLSMLGKNRYDGVFLCWFLEHVPEPGRVLDEAYARLKRGGQLYASEVFNQTFYLAPSSSLIESYWREFNDQQRELGGDPNVGPKLGGLLKKAGFGKIATELRSLQFDARDDKARSAFLTYLEELMLSGAASLIASGRVAATSRGLLEREFKNFARDRTAALHLGFFHASARK